MLVSLGIVMINQVVLLLVLNGVEHIVQILVQLVMLVSLGIVMKKEHVLELAENGVLVVEFHFLLTFYLVGVLILARFVNQLKFGVVMMKLLVLVLVETGVVLGVAT